MSICIYLQDSNLNISLLLEVSGKKSRLDYLLSNFLGKKLEKNKVFLINYRENNLTSS